MISRIWKIIMVWISVLCLSTVLLITWALESGNTIPIYFVSGYVIAILICILMFCTILSIILSTFSPLEKKTKEVNTVENKVINRTMSEIAKQDLSSISSDNETSNNKESIVSEVNQAEYNNSAPTPEEIATYDGKGAGHGL